MADLTLKPPAVRDGLNYVTCVSWPRSGHHMLERVLAAYFGARWGYCEFYTCCKSYPCAKQETVFSKNHDLGGRFNVANDVPLIVQYRSFLPSILSDFDFRVYKGGKADAKDELFAFAVERLPVYTAFISKWGAPKFGRVVIDYDALTVDPYNTIRGALPLFTRDPVDEAHLQTAIEMVSGHKIAGKEGEAWTKEMGVKNTRALEAHRFYDKEAFALISDTASSVVDRVTMLKTELAARA